MDDATSAPGPRARVEGLGEPVTSARRGTVCMACRYDLAGQRVYNESHYRMNVVACPECGNVQAYGPRFRGRRAERTRASLVAFLWVCFIIAMVVWTAASLAGLSQSTAYAASIPFAQHISNEYVPSQAHLGYSNSLRDGATIWELVPESWWDANRERVLAQFGGRGGGTDWIVLTDLLYLAPLCLALALLWRVVLAHVHAAALGLTVLLAIAVGALGLLAYFTISTAPPGWEYAVYDAESIVGRPVGWASYIVGSLGLLFSLWASGPILALIARRLAPPSVRAKLWRFEPGPDR